MKLAIYECDPCSSKSGAPTLCDPCLRARAAAGFRWRGARLSTWLLELFFEGRVVVTETITVTGRGTRAWQKAREWFVTLPSVVDHFVFDAHDKEIRCTPTKEPTT